MQNAECIAECIADADCIAELQIRKHSGAISNGLRARSAGPDSIAHAHSAGPGILGQGPSAKGRPEASEMSLGAVLGSIFERPGVSWRGPGGVPGRP